MVLAISAGGALADTCPAAPDHRVKMTALIIQVRQAKTEGAARQITNQMWELWADAPDEPAQVVLDKGMRLRRSYDLLRALGELDRLVAYCPNYAEGYNQRAFASFLARDFEAALTDLNRAIDLIPNHIAALSGRGMTLLGLGREDEANASIRAALALNPWLAERAMIVEPDGVDI